MTKQRGLLRPAPPTARRCPTRPPRTGDDRPQGGNWEGKTALEVAEEQGEAEVAAVLAGELSQEAKGQWLRRAANEGQAGPPHAINVAMLLQSGAAVDATNNNGVTALMRAAYMGEVECARLLLEAGADASLRATGGPFKGMAALEVAETKGEGWYCEEVAALLRGRMRGRSAKK